MAVEIPHPISALVKDLLDVTCLLPFHRDIFCDVPLSATSRTKQGSILTGSCYAEESHRKRFAGS